MFMKCSTRTVTGLPGSRPLRRSNTKRGSCAASRPNLVGGMSFRRRNCSILRISMAAPCGESLSPIRRAQFPTCLGKILCYVGKMVKPANSSRVEPRERLRQLKQEQGVSYAQLARLLGRNAAYLQQFVERGSPRELGERDRRLLAGFFGVAETELGASQETSSTGGRAVGGWIDVPRLALDASAGPGAVPAEEIPYDTFRFSRRWLAEQNLAPDQLSSITVAGDSMEPLIRAGDEILIDRTPRPLRDGI